MIFLLKQIISQFFSPQISHILVVLQNNNELRSNGGYITGVIEIRLGKCSLQKSFLDVNTDLKHTKKILPPKSMQDLLKVKDVQFRDANYSLDFKESANRMVELFKYTFPEKNVSQIVAINFGFLEALLGLLGGVSVQGEKINAQNLFFVLSTKVSNIDLHDLDERAQRKNILKQLASKIIQSSVTRFWHWAGLIRLCKKSIIKRDIQIFYLNPSRQKKLEKQKLFMPVIPQKEKDYLMVIDNNYLGIKSNRYIYRTISHKVHFNFQDKKRTLSDARVEVKVILQHMGGKDYPLSGIYQSYTALCFPKNAQDVKVITSNIQHESLTEGKFQKVGFYNQIQPGEEREMKIQYILPASLFQDNKYSFHYSRQSGVDAETVFDSVKIPEQFSLESDFSKQKIKESAAFFAHQEGDYQYEIMAKLHKESPRIFYHKIVAPQKIEVRFNEQVFPIESKEAIAILKEKISQKEVQITNVEFTHDNYSILIHTKDLPPTKEQFYHLFLSNLQNKAGIPLKPSPRRVTVVYRPQYFIAVKTH